MNQPSKTIPEDKVLVRGARQLLTLQGSEHPRRGGSLGELSIVADGAILIRGCAIIEVGTSRRVENLKDARGAREIDATGRVVMPGFVDACAQLVQVQPRLDAYESMLRGAAESQGAADGRPLRAASAHRLEGHVRKLASFVGIQCGQQPFGNRPLIEYLKQARKLGLAVEILAGCERAARLAVEAEAVSLHIGRVQPAEIKLLAESSTIAVLAPASLLYLEPRRFASARALIDSRVAVALASGFAPDWGPTSNMQTVISLACLEMHMTPAEAICAATINAANAQGCANRLGLLGPRKQADLVLLHIEDYRELPYYFGTNHVHLVVKNGCTTYHEGRVRP